MADEAALQRDISSAYTRAGWICLKKHPGGTIPKGWPDQECYGSGGRHVFIEVKDPDDPEPDAIQAWVHDALRRLGHKVIVATTLEQATEPIQEESR